MDGRQTKQNNAKRFRRLSRFVTPAALVATAVPGDLIEIDRLVYSHWALYVGNGKAIHVTADSGDIGENEARVLEETVAGIARESLVRVNNKLVPAKSRGVKPKAAEETVRAARQNLGRTVLYNMITRNCEHYTTQWKYGLAWSDQVNNI